MLDAVQLHLFKRAVFVGRNAAVIEQIAVDSGIQCAVAEEEPNVPLQLFGIQERRLQRVEQLALFRSQIIWVCRVERREILVPQWPDLTFDLDSARRKVDLIQQQTLVELVFRVR